MVRDEREVIVTFLLPAEKRVSAKVGANLRALALEHGVGVYRLFDRLANCGGLGECGTCVVEVVDGAEHLSPVEPLEAELLARKRDASRRRLACRATVLGPVTVKTRPPK